MPQIESLVMQTAMAQLERASLNEEQLAGARATIEQITQIMADYRTAIAHIMADGRLSSAGKQTDLATAAEKADERLAHVGDTRLETLDARIPELEFETRPQQPDTDPVLELLRQQEIRALVAMHPELGDELQLRAHYLALASDGTNDLMMRAIEAAPIPLISDPAILEAGQRARGERQYGEGAKTLKQLRAIRKTIKDALDSARGELRLPDLTLQNVAEGTAA